MGNFSKLKNVDLPYKSDSLQFKRFIDESTLSTPYYQIQGPKKVDADDLTILDDFEFQGIDFDNIREDEFQVDSDDDETPNGSYELNFQEYSVSYVRNDTSMETIKIPETIIDEEEINRQAQSSPKLNAQGLNNLIYNLSLDEFDFQVRGDGEDELDVNKLDESLHLDDVLQSVDNDDFIEQEIEPVRNSDLDQDEEDTMDIDVLGSSSSVTSNDDDFTATYSKLEDFLNSPELFSKPSKIPIRFVPNEPSNKIVIHEDPSKLPLSRQRPVSLYQQTLKKSARLQPQEYHRFLKSPNRICSPKRSILPTRSVLKVRKNLLNLIVDAASGDQKEAARYGTEINSQNCEGVPLPESTKELVTIPTNNSKETHKAAIIKAIAPLEREMKLQDITAKHNETLGMGFYTERDFYKYMTTKKRSSNGKENETLNPIKRLKVENEEINTITAKQVKWADNLEW